jgi:hypothetical protein
MEGKGAYNRHARLQAGGGALALPQLEEAARKIELGPSDQPVVIADYGSSQGKNSLAPLRGAIRVLRSRLGTNRPIFTYHIDQPANDFNSLFAVLDTDSDRYALDEPNIFPCAIGRSFYENVLPDNHVNLGWSSYAAVWLSKIPMPIPGHFMMLGSTGAVRAAFDQQGARDWEAFLALRARELRFGGRLVIVLPGLDDRGVAGFESIFDHANAVLAEMVDEGEIKAEERERIVLGAYVRRLSDLVAPFGTEGQFNGLIAECCEMSVLPDAAWLSYEQHGDKELLAAKHASFFRATFMPSLTQQSIEQAASVEQQHHFADRFEQRLKRRLADEPGPLHSYVQLLVVAKVGAVP